MAERPVPLTGTAGVTYLGRLLDTIELVTGPAPASSYRQASKLLGIPPSTAHRLLTLLRDRGYCDRGDDGAFRPGPALLSIGVQVLEQLPQWRAATAAVEELGAATGESASFGMIISDEIVLIARHNSPNPLTAVASVGDLVQPYTSALGKAVLSVGSPELRAKLVRKVSPGVEEDILREIESELEVTRRRGFGIDEESFTPGMRCRAVPVFDQRTGLMGGLSVSGPSVRFTKARAALSLDVLEQVATRLTKSLGSGSKMRVDGNQPSQCRLAPSGWPSRTTAGLPIRVLAPPAEAGCVGGN